MKRIMFNDKYGLTRSVLEGNKTVTRRVIAGQKAFDFLMQTFGDDGKWVTDPEWAAYQVGEDVAVAQCYRDVYLDYIGTPSFKQEHSKEAGWKNKMFVKSSLMPNRIRIKSVRAERLQDITDEDCRRECTMFYNFADRKYEVYGLKGQFATPRDGFAALIDKVGGSGTWESNPWVVRYEFELLRKEYAQ